MNRQFILSLVVLILSTNVVGKSLKKINIEGNVIAISYEKTKALNEVKKARMIPRGSALITGSGELKKSGIKHIIHAATGSMTQSSNAFKPNIEGIKNSIINSLILAHEFKHKSIAIPFLGGGIFLKSLGVTKKELVRIIMESAVKNNPFGMKVSFVTWSTEDTKLFKSIFAQVFKNNQNFRVIKGSITDFKAHQSSVIVNAANMEVLFGGGLSGVIGRATKNSSEIDSSAHQFIKKFYKL